MALRSGVWRKATKEKGKGGREAKAVAEQDDRFSDDGDTPQRPTGDPPGSLMVDGRQVETTCTGIPWPFNEIFAKRKAASKAQGGASLEELLDAPDPIPEEKGGNEYVVVRETTEAFATTAEAFATTTEATTLSSETSAAALGGGLAAESDRVRREVVERWRQTEEEAVVAAALDDRRDEPTTLSDAALARLEVAARVAEDLVSEIEKAAGLARERHREAARRLETSRRTFAGETTADLDRRRGDPPRGEGAGAGGEEDLFFSPKSGRRRLKEGSGHSSSASSSFRRRRWFSSSSSSSTLVVCRFLGLVAAACCSLVSLRWFLSPLLCVDDRGAGLGSEKERVPALTSFAASSPLLSLDYSASPVFSEAPAVRAWARDWARPSRKFMSALVLIAETAELEREAHANLQKLAGPSVLVHHVVVAECDEDASATSPCAAVAADVARTLCEARTQRKRVLFALADLPLGHYDVHLPFFTLIDKAITRNRDLPGDCPAGDGDGDVDVSHDAVFFSTSRVDHPTKKRSKRDAIELLVGDAGNRDGYTGRLYLHHFFYSDYDLLGAK